MSRHEVPTTSSGFGARARILLSGGKPRAIASLGIVLGLGAIGTLAAWSDSATATSGVFSTGSVDLQLNNDPGNPTAYAFASLTKTNMMPGNSVAATLPVQNKGTVPFSYTMVANSTSSTLAPYLKVLVSTGTSNGTACSGGTVIANNLALTSGGSTNVIPTGRALNNGASETLCFQVTLDPSVLTSEQNKTVSTSFNFNATTA
ncbi:SipW-dependent-type signal peptide-containing protein [Rhodococcus tukisamuensis]|uniref:SipW-cognate class signal peptide n=1 Tax=Rhodococcus tukisamuensis TaxID=168276 RepID=A0A1G6SCV2_9NOCA|nr:SipW-dependent-type signal peptide-containing protein [Rhodococcus tukisamuensis]SDD14740.1 SipW-cognate class signal peptide [Rhodococcus tukisamuensis]